MDSHTKSVLSDIITKAALEPEFRARLFGDPSRTLDEFEIGDAEKTIIVQTIAGLCE